MGSIRHISNLLDRENAEDEFLEAFNEPDADYDACIRAFGETPDPTQFGVCRIGIDCGSKTVKAVAFDEHGKLIYKSYLRHLSNIRATLARSLREMREKVGDIQGRITFTGSAGMQIAEDLNIPFIQEVVASKTAVLHFNPGTDAVIELGGEDSKILFLTDGEELRMNSTCAGGTGGFIDSIAGMLGTNAAGLSLAYASRTTKRPIASRCAVFARNDVRSMLNEGATKGDIAASTFMAVVNQCVSGLACGRRIGGHVVLLGGPLHYLDPLAECFREVLGLDETTGVVPKNAHLYVAMGAALNSVNDAGPLCALSDVEAQIQALELGDDSLLQYLEPLFESNDEFQQWQQDHKQYELPHGRMWGYDGPMYFGVDSGSTTMKSVLTDDKGNVLHTFYRKNDGDVITSARYLLKDLYQSMMMAHTAVGDNAYIANVAVTGYGEDLMRRAFGFDCGVVETVAHLKAAQRLMPDVDSVIDIGGQDIKCIRVRDGHIDDISLNEACSSGCGGLLSSMANDLMLTDFSFARTGVESQHPVDLGMRCAVFMTSRVRHAQKVGASTGDISAGMAYSVVKNALYRVMSVQDVSELGEHVVVQGGTFKNDAVLRAFEKLLGRRVARADKPELMGAYGAALYAIENDNGQPSTILNAFRASTVKADRASRHCDLCGNNCLLTETKVSHSIDEACQWNPMIFVQKGVHSMGSDDTDKYRKISATFVMGNRCSRPVAENHADNAGLGLMDRQYERLFRIDAPAEQHSSAPGAPATIGIPRALEMYEQFPFWQAFFGSLGFRVAVSGKSSAELYRQGMGNVTSESTCYPAKLAHGHVVDLLARGVDAVFYPLLRNEDEALDCPVICDYANILRAGVETPAGTDNRPQTQFIAPRIANTIVHGAGVGDEHALFEAVRPMAPHLSAEDIHVACTAGAQAMKRYFDDIANYVEEARSYVQEQGDWGAVVSCRPYHLDPEINHGIPALLGSYGLTVISSDAVWAYIRKHGQAGDNAAEMTGSGWRVPDRQRIALQWATCNDWCELVSLYSFGCGIDVCMHEEMRAECKKRSTSFTALKVDDMTDISSIRIRLRSLLAALLERDRGKFAEIGRTGRTVEIRGLESSNGACACACVCPETSAYAETSAFDCACADEAETTSPARTALRTPLFLPNWMPTHMALMRPVFAEAGYTVAPCSDSNGISEGVALANSDLCQTILSAVGQFAEFQRRQPDEPATVAVPLACTNCCSRSIDRLAGNSIEGFAENRAVCSLEDMVVQHAGAAFSTQLAQAIVAGDVITQLTCMLQACGDLRPHGEIADELIGKTLAFAASGAAESMLDAALRTAEANAQTGSSLICAERGNVHGKTAIAIVGNASLALTPNLNNRVFDRIAAEDCQAIPPALATQAIHSARTTASLCRNARVTHPDARAAADAIERARCLESFANELTQLQSQAAARMTAAGACYAPALSYHTLEQVARIHHLDCDVQAGAGWCSQATMLSLLDAGYFDILYVQTFTCLSNHVGGSATFKEVRAIDPRANLTQVEYDTGISQVNQINRIKLLAALAKSREH